MINKLLSMICVMIVVLGCDDHPSQPMIKDQQVNVVDRSVLDRSMLDRSVLDMDQQVNVVDGSVLDGSVLDGSVLDGSMLDMSVDIDQQVNIVDMSVLDQSLMPNFQQPILIEETGNRPEMQINQRSQSPVNHIEHLGDWMLVEWASLDMALLPWGNIDSHPVNIIGLPSPIQSSAYIDENLLVLAQGQIYVVRGGEARLSPISQVVDHPILALLGYENEIWFATSEAIYLWRAGNLHRLLIHDLDLTQAPKLVLGARFRGVPAIWIADRDHLFAVERLNPMLRTWLISSGIEFKALYADQWESLWGLTEGLLYHRAPSGVWQSYLLDMNQEILGLSANPSSPLIWFWNDQQLWSGMYVAPNFYVWDYAMDFDFNNDIQNLISDSSGAIFASHQGIFEMNLDSRSFPVPPPLVTWDHEIRPIYERNCASCHQAGGIARLLDRSELWIDQFDLILHSIQLGQMPLGARPLSLGDQIKIQDWRNGGFR
jgi:hypothetical protein